MGGDAIDGDWESASSFNDVIRTLVLVGRTGNGKSATGNSILFREAFKSMVCLDAVTSTCEMHKTVLDDGTKINVIDTPGLFEFSKPENFGREIVKCIDLAKDGIHAILVVFSLTARFSQEEAAAIQHLESLFGSKIFNYMIVVFTGGDVLECNKLTLKEYFARGCPALFKETLSRCENRAVVFDNCTNDNTKKSKQVQQLLSLVNLVISENGGRPYSDELFIELKNGAMKLRDHHSLLDEHFKHLIEKVELKFKETADRLQQQLAEERAERVKAEESAQEEHRKSNEEIQKLREKLEKTERELAEKCTIL